MKKDYKKPSMSILEFDKADVLTIDQSGEPTLKPMEDELPFVSF